MLCRTDFNYISLHIMLDDGGVDKSHNRSQ